MSLNTIAAMMEQHLRALVGPGAVIAFENVLATPPAGPYYIANLLPATPPVQGDGVCIDQGIFQVTCCDAAGRGAGEAQAMAHAVRTHFKRGTTLQQDDVSVSVINNPAQASGFPDASHYRVPVSVPWLGQYPQV
jgi:hypothetical protein